MKILNQERVKNKNKLNLGAGRMGREEYINIDKQPYTGGNGDQKVDLLLDLEDEKLPFDDNEIEHIRAFNVFEHLGDGFIHCLNECHRVLKEERKLKGVVPVAGTREDFKDPTDKRHFIKQTFAYFTGKNEAKESLPSRPRYADYGIRPWHEVKLDEHDQLLKFELRPRKINE